MLKKRIIAIELLLNARLVKTKQFGTWRDVGDPVKSSAVYNSQNVDELVLLSIDRQQRSTAVLAEWLKKISEVCFMPLSIGGGVTGFDDAAFLIKNGADKVVINSAAYRDKALLGQVADRFGSQAVVVGIDVRRDATDGRPCLFSDCGRRAEPVDLDDHIGDCIEAGAGEIFIQSIDNDGMMEGFDIPLIAQAQAKATVPVIAAGGSGTYEMLKEAFLETDVSALACGSMFNFTDSHWMRAKAHLTNYGLPFKAV